MKTDITEHIDLNRKFWPIEADKKNDPESIPLTHVIPLVPRKSLLMPPELIFGSTHRRFQYLNVAALEVVGIDFTVR